MQERQHTVLNRKCPATEESLCEPRKEFFIASGADLPSRELNGEIIGPCLVLCGIHNAERGRGCARWREAGLRFDSASSG